MTGAPIYLVSACTSGEEFVAAFRRYTDKNGLFIPMSEPLPAGGRSRFAVTLKDGGVMIEGLAEIVSSARTASVVHGRVGMTLRFLEPDAASKTILGELEKARLSMRPPPPSVAPRPAEIPPVPRPVPPPVQGRIDAVNALAECVAIGDTGALGPPLRPAPPKAGPRFVVPAVPTTGLGVTPSTSTPVRPSTTPLPMAVVAPGKPDRPESRDRRDTREPRDQRDDVRPPSITPRASPPPEALRTGIERRSDPAHAAVPTISGLSRTMTSVPPAQVRAPAASPGPISDTLVAAAPPAPPPPQLPVTAQMSPSGATSAPRSDGVAREAPLASSAEPAPPRRAMEMPVAVPRTTTRPGTPAPTLSAPSITPPANTNINDGPISATMTAVPVPTPGSTQRSAPTEIGGPLVKPLPAIDVEIDPESDPALQIVAMTRARDDASARTQIHAGAPRPEPPGPVRAAPLPVSAVTSEPRFAGSVRRTLPEIEIAEPTDLWVGPPEPTPPQDPEGPEGSSSPEAETSSEESTPIEQSTPMEPSQPHDAAGSRPRRTVIGVVITPPGVTVLPAKGSDSSQLASEEPTRADRIVIGDRTVDAAAPTTLPEPPRWSTSEPVAPRRDWTMPPPRLAGRTTPGAPISLADGTAPLAPHDGPAADAPVAPGASPIRAGGSMSPARIASVAAAGAGPAAPSPPAAIPLPPGLPSGDWTIALDPQAPDGWTEPFQPAGPQPLSDEPSPDSSRRPPPRPAGPLVAEPKVQIDPTLIEPVTEPSIDASTIPPGGLVERVQLDAQIDSPRPLPSEGPLRAMRSDHPSQLVPPEELFRHTAGSSQDIPGYGAPATATAASALPIDLMSVPQRSAFMAPHGPPVMMHPGQVPPYPMNAGYQVVPVGMPQPRPSNAGGGGSGIADPRYPSWRAQNRRRHAIIVIASALVAVVMGIIVLLVLGSKREADPGDHPSDTRSPAHQAPQAATADPASPARPAAAGSSLPSNPAPPERHSPAGVAEAPATTTMANPPASSGCFASVTSLPPGAEIVVDNTSVLGTTPQKIELPCGRPTDLVIRKPRMISATRTVTPTPEGIRVKVVLTRLTFLVKVSSTPAGATVTVNGKALGITPTTIKVPAFEPSTLTLAKDGYIPETEKVAPKANGTAVHTALKRLDPKKPG